MSKKNGMEVTEEGLLLRGVVAGRSRRTVGEKMSELVTYKVTANREGNREMYLKDWNPDGKYFTVGEQICVPVTAKVYFRNGRSMLDYTLCKGNGMIGEEF